MASKTSRRRGRVYPLKVVNTTALGALASNDCITDLLSTTTNRDVFLISADLTWGITEYQGDFGPLNAGVAHGDYTAGEIEECLESVAAWDRGDLVAREQSKRKVRIAGSFPGEDSEEMLNDGIAIHTKLGFMLNAGDTLSIWAFNQFDAALTAGTLLKVMGTIWARDA